MFNVGDSPVGSEAGSTFGSEAGSPVGSEAGSSLVYQWRYPYPNVHCVSSEGGKCMYTGSYENYKYKLDVCKFQGTEPFVYWAGSEPEHNRESIPYLLHMMEKEDIGMVVVLNNNREKETLTIENRWWKRTDFTDGLGYIWGQTCKEQNNPDANIHVYEVQVRRRSPVEPSLSYFHSYKVVYLDKWADFGVVKPSTLVELGSRVVYEGVKSGVRSVLVHCNAGVGRTGTFVAYSQLLYQLKTKPTEEQMKSWVEDKTRELRQVRTEMIQNEKQSKLVRDALASIATTMSSSNRTVFNPSSIRKPHSTPLPPKSFSRPPSEVTGPRAKATPNSSTRKRYPTAKLPMRSATRSTNKVAQLRSLWESRTK